MGEGAIGSMLTIPSKLLQDVTKADQLVNKLGEDSEKTTEKLSKAFDDMLPKVNSLADALRSFKTELKEIKDTGLSDIVNAMKDTAKYTENAAKSASALGKNFGGAAGNIIKATSNINALSSGISYPGMNGTRIVAHSDEARSKMILQQMSEYYRKLEAASEKKARKIEKDREREAKAAERAAEREIKAAEAVERKRINELNKANYNSREAYRNSYQGSMYYADGATSIDSRTRAIKYLTEARNNLSTTDRNYAQNLNNLNNKIKELNRLNREAIDGADELKRNHSQLMDTTAQLARSFSLLFSVSQIKGYAEKLINIRGEFELQQRSLEAILQNKSQADQIFSQTVALAVRSPFRVKELVSYTKQMAAYRIESDKLYDTTKRLADVSAGLGVDMQRLILAYGQVKAAAYLRATEVRQFTEAGINLYGELQRYFEETRGEAYTTAQIVDMISSRKITFEDIENVFKRLTDQGGLFYNMQEIQAETLAGKISNLKDKLDLMLNEIGKDTEGVIKGAVNISGKLLENWELIADIAKLVLSTILAINIQRKMSSSVSSGMLVSIKRYISEISVAETRTGKLGAAWKGLGASVKAGIAGIGIGAALILASKLYSKLKESSDRLKEINKEFSANLIRTNLTSRTFHSYDSYTYGEDKTRDSEVFAKQKEQLAKLSNELGKLGLSIPVKLENITQENIREVFVDAEQKLKTVSESVNFLQRMSAKTGEGLKKGVASKVKNFTEYTDEIVGSGLEIQNTINELYSNNINLLSDKQKEMLERLSKGAEEGQSAMDFYVKAILALRDITYNNPNLRADGGFWGNFYEDRVRGLYANFLHANNELSSLQNNWREFFRELSGSQPELINNLKNGNTAIAASARETFKAILKEFTSKEEYGAAATECFERFALQWANEMGINGLSFKISEEGVKEQASWVDKYLKDFFESKKYKANISVDSSDVTKSLTAVDKWTSERDEKVKKAKKLKDFGESFKRGTGYTGINELKVTQELLDFMGYGDNYVSPTISKDAFNKRLKQLEAEINAEVNALGGTLDNNKSKRERDIWQERIDVLKKMHDQYESVREYLSADEATAFIKSTFEESVKESGLSRSIADAYVPDKEGLIIALKKLYDEMPDAIKQVKKGNDLKQSIDILEVGINKDNLKVDLESAKREIEGQLNAIDLRNKLKKQGLLDYQISQLFPQIPSTTSFGDVAETIRHRFGVSKEMDKLSANDLSKAIGAGNAKSYREEMDKLNKRIADDKMNTVNDLVGKYKDKLSEQLQIDLWYAEERKKIEENITDIAQRNEMLRNLDNQRGEKSDNLAWSDFKKSDDYIRIFEDMDSISSRTLDSMLIRLRELRSSLKNLNPTQLKEIVRQEEKIQEAMISRNPFGSVASNAGQFFSFLGNRRNLQNQLGVSEAKEAGLATQEAQESEYVKNLQEAYDLQVKLYGAESEQATQAKLLLDTHALNLDKIKAQRKEQADTTANLKKQIADGQKAGVRLNKALGATRDVVDGLGGKSKQLASIWSDDVADGIGRAIDTFDAVTDSVQQVLKAVGVTSTSVIATTAATSAGANAAIETTSEVASTSIKSVEKASVILAVISAALQIAIAIANLVNTDAKKQKEIDKLQKKVEDLQRAYEKLKTAMDSAYSSAELVRYNEQMVKNLNLQIELTRAKLQLERDKKKTDKDKIREYTNEIEDLETKLNELADDVKEKFGGIGSQANYKSAAQAFSDAWFDAFNECEDTLDALNDKFNDYFDNLIKKQITNRAAKQFLTPILDEFNKAVAENSAGGNNGTDITREELDKINQLKDYYLPRFDEYVQNLMDMLGITPRGNATLSALQQGIQGITEREAEALESLLNSMRFYLATQQNDVAVIRGLLESQNERASDSPILSELKAQTNLIMSINNILGDVTTYSNRHGGRGFKVYME